MNSSLVFTSYSLKKCHCGRSDFADRRIRIQGVVRRLDLNPFVKSTKGDSFPLFFVCLAMAFVLQLLHTALTGYRCLQRQQAVLYLNV